ncbi:TetR family transcriptional regulator [Actinomycetota bacterium]|nr:TetR family transcriptional regulator [Actinomycetota bacterium]
MPRDARRAQVLSVAQDLFTSEGFHHVSMDDIAERAAVSKPVLYRHFPSKLDLYLAVVDLRGAELLAAVELAVAPLLHRPEQPADAQQVVAAVVQAYVDFVESAGESATLLFESDVTHDADVRTRVERSTAGAAQRIAQALVEVARLPAPHATVLAVGITAMAQAAATYRYRTTDVPTAQQTADLVSRFVWCGVSGLMDHPVAEGGGAGASAGSA